MVEGGGGGRNWWWWAAASSAQLTAAIVSLRRGCGEGTVTMPLKAFAVASLFVGAGATSVAGALDATGIHTVNDLKEVGASIRRGLRVPPREKTG